MRKRFSAVGMLAAIFSLAFVSNLSAADLTVAVSLQPYSEIVKGIGGDKIDVITLLPPGADPHTFEPKPASLKEFSKATVYFGDGSGMDNAWMPRFKGVNRNVQVLDISKGIEWIALSHDEKEEHHHDHHHGVHEHEGDLDPHVWTSPMRVAVIARNVCDGLIQLDPKNREYYSARLEGTLNRLNTLDGELRKAIAKIPENMRTFVVFHPSYGYFAKDYGMTQLSIEVNGKEPKPKDLAHLIKEGKEHSVHIVFVQPQFSKRAAETIAKELDAVVKETDPLSSDYESSVRALIQAIDDAAKKNLKNAK